MFTYLLDPSKYYHSVFIFFPPKLLRNWRNLRITSNELLKYLEIIHLRYTLNVFVKISKFEFNRENAAHYDRLLEN